MTQTTHLALPFIEAAQAQKHVTHNEALALIDALTQLSVSARDVTSPPATPAEGDRVLIGAGATGAFAGKTDQIGTFLAGGWTFLSAQAGWRAYVEAESLLLLYDSAGWIDCGLSLRQLQNLALLGIGATADGANPLLAKLNATLFTAKSVGEGGSGDLRFALNKESAAKTVSQLYQSNYSARAETGLTGDDNFHVKVSPDGSAWNESIVVDRTTGAVAFPSGGPTKVRVFASSGSYTPTPGLRFAEVLLFGAGGGGGSGARTASGAAASGGAGGGGGGLARGRFTAAQIGASKAVAIGAGGSGGAAQTTNSTNGNAGSAGGVTTFGTLLHAGAGGGGAGGQIGGASGGGGAGSQASSGLSGSGGTGGVGSFGVGSGGSGAVGAAGSHVFGGGGGGGCNAAGSTAAAGGSCLYNGPSGGGAGGGITAANAVANGGAGGAVYVAGLPVIGAAGIAASAVNGGVGGSWVASAGPFEQAGGGGGGGASSLTGPGAGGAGGLAGGGGGGGGSVQNGANSGAGGNGGDGYALIFEFF
ncbi:DUF2793 domain-containing protein [Methylocystis sp. SB2]|uniref:DUF2793 domain-containing protein n=2 Tax=Methylocystis sp. (strain SB2) TaxID=743836 RepID=UPI003CE504AA